MIDKSKIIEKVAFFWHYGRFCRSYLRYLHYKRKFSSGVAPMKKRIWVDPQNIEYMIVPRFQKSLPFYGHYVKNGDWDERISHARLDGVSTWSGERTRIPISKYDMYQSMVERYERGIPWEETDYFRRKTGKEPSNTRAIEEVRYNYFNEIDELYESIRTNGYKTQPELGRDSGYRLKTSGYHEILVNIGRDGSILFDDGRHRFFIAKILGLESIPVRVFVRHEGWQEKRSRIAEGDSKTLDEFRDHPDIVEDESLDT